MVTPLTNATNKTDDYLFSHHRYLREILLLEILEV